MAAVRDPWSNDRLKCSCEGEITPLVKDSEHTEPKLNCDCSFCEQFCSFTVLVQGMKKDGTPRRYKTKERCRMPRLMLSDRPIEYCRDHWNEMKAAAKCLAMTPEQRAMQRAPLTNKIQ